jgi:hypothetical protein
MFTNNCGGYPRRSMWSSEHKTNGRRLSIWYCPTDLLNHSMSTVTTLSASSQARQDKRKFYLLRKRTIREAIKVKR